VNNDPYVIYDGRWMTLSQSWAQFKLDYGIDLERQEAQDRARAEAWAAEAKQERQAQAVEAMGALMERIEFKEQHPLKQRLGRQSSLEGALRSLTDHEFIEFKFELAARPSRRWLAPL
jgi:hypothetical protein